MTYKLSFLACLSCTKDVTYNNILLAVFQVIKAVNQTFSFEEDLQEIDEAQDSFMKFFEEKLRYVI